MLGVAPDATDEELARAYREAAKRFHPDRAHGDGGWAGERMREVNAAYASVTALRRARGPRVAADAPVRGGRYVPGGWLRPELRRALGTELLRVLEAGESIVLVTDAVAWDAGRVRLAVTDRRLLWLRDDAVLDRVRFLRYRAVDKVEGRLRPPRRRTGELRVYPQGARRVRFSDLRPEVLHTILGAVVSRLR